MAFNRSSSKTLYNFRAGMWLVMLVCVLAMQPTASFAQKTKEKETVTVHTDPRMAILLKKNRTFIPPDPPPAPPAPVVVHKTEAPPKLAVATPPPVHDSEPVSSAPASHRDGRVTFSGRGFRVQIYNGPDRNKAIAAKTEFMRHNPGVHTYIIYNQPNFRVKVGNYRNRTDAEGMLKEAGSTYGSSVMIVPDDIVVNAN